MVVIVVVGFLLDGERDGESFVVVVIRGRIQQQLYIHANPKANLFLSHLEFRLRDLPFHIHPSPHPPVPVQQCMSIKLPTKEAADAVSIQSEI